MSGLAAKLELNASVRSDFRIFKGIIKHESFMECFDYFDKIREIIIHRNSDRDIHRKAANL